MSLTDHDRIITSLEALRAAEAGCVYHATARVVAGEGAAAAKLMMVGEQAGPSSDPPERACPRRGPTPLA
jgi:hypothetical protein